MGLTSLRRWYIQTVLWFTLTDYVQYILLVGVNLLLFWIIFKCTCSVHISQIVLKAKFVWDSPYCYLGVFILYCWSCAKVKLLTMHINVSAPLPVYDNLPMGFCCCCIYYWGADVVIKDRGYFWRHPLPLIPKYRTQVPRAA